MQATAPGAWENVTLIAGITTAGVVAPLALPGVVDRQVFQTYVAEALVPELVEGDVVVWDNLQAHKNPAVVAAIEAVGARVEPLPAAVASSATHSSGSIWPRRCSASPWTGAGRWPRPWPAMGTMPPTPTTRS